MKSGLPSTLVSKPPPRGLVYRVARGPNPLEPPPSRTCHNRFDDPEALSSITPKYGYFTTNYYAIAAVGAFGETIARFRPSLNLLAELADIEDEDKPFDPAEYEAILPESWRIVRRLGSTTLATHLRFVDLQAPETIQALRSVPAIARLARSLDIKDIDYSTVNGPNRHLTQAVARYIYEQTDSDERPLYAGIYYSSRLYPAWGCLATFNNRITDIAEIPMSIHADNPDLVNVAALFGISIEIVPGTYITPYGIRKTSI